MTGGDINPNCLSYWFPKIQYAGLPVPKTEIVHMPDGAKVAAYCVINGDEPSESELAALDQFCDELELRADELGFPVFLRTGHTSGKHDWERTCCLTSAEHIDSHVASLVEHSECAGILGLPYDVWAVREMLPTEPVGVCRAYGNMPICREFRFFADDREVWCWHPYWPEQALKDGALEMVVDDEWSYRKFCKLGIENRAICKDLALRAAQAVGGFWSVDILETERGWTITDMARAEDSWHWPGCSIGERLRP